MESSRTRNSILDWLIAATAALAVISGTAGFSVDLGAFAIQSHGPLRLLVVAAVLAAIRWRLGIESPPSWAARVVLLTVICGSVAAWLRFLLTTIGGADSYGYVSASRLIAEGRLTEQAPIAEWLSLPNRLAVASPLGWRPAPDGASIAPAYPLGLPVVMALFTVVGGPAAVFAVAPVAGLITLWLVHRITQQWYDAETALLATALAAWNPVFIAYAKQPMSDVLATMWIALAVLLAWRSSRASAFAAGLAAGAAVMTRPVLLVAAVAIVIVSIRLKPDTTQSPPAGVVSAFRRIDKHQAILASAGLFIFIAIQLLLNWRLFGSPFATGYGAAGGLFALSNIASNVGLYARQLWVIGGPLWIVGLALGLIAARPEPRSKPLLVFGGVALPYLFFLPIDHWETLRFLLPGLMPLAMPVADGLIKLARWPRQRVAAAVITVVFSAATVAWSENLLRRSNGWDIASLEARYPLAGEWVSINTPPTSVVLANQHSGSLRWYGKRQTLRWDFIAPEHLAQTVSDLASRGATTYVALEGAEVAMFDERFAAVIDQLQVDHVGRIRNVYFRRLTRVP